jgi:hypothetical protein
MEGVEVSEPVSTSSFPIFFFRLHDLSKVIAKSCDLLPPSPKGCRHFFLRHKFDRIYRKYMQHLCLEMNFIKTIFKYLSNDINFIP